MYIDRNIIMANKYVLKWFSHIVLNIQNLNIKTFFRKFESVDVNKKRKIYSFTLSLMKFAIKKNLRPNNTHTHTHTYIYIY